MSVPHLPQGELPPSPGLEVPGSWRCSLAVLPNFKRLQGNPGGVAASAVFRGPSQTVPPFPSASGEAMCPARGSEQRVGGAARPAMGIPQQLQEKKQGDLEGSGEGEPAAAGQGPARGHLPRAVLVAVNPRCSELVLSESFSLHPTVRGAGKGRGARSPRG